MVNSRNFIAEMPWAPSRIDLTKRRMARIFLHSPANSSLSAAREPIIMRAMTEKQEAVIGVVTASDRASAGVYQDESGPAIAAYFHKILTSPFRIERRVIPDGFESVRDTLIELADVVGCDLVVTTGGTGPSPRDLTPEATLAAAPRELPGFGELMRKVSLEQVPTAILSRQLAAHRGKCLIINLPGKPAAIELCLDAVMPAVPYCLDLIGAAYIETDPARIVAFRPKGK
jgi:molybdopterin adenylyltransferase